MSVPGAVAADAPDEAVAGHYGDPAGEQRAWERGPAIVDRSHFGVVVVDGPDRLSWLHALTSQALDDLPPNTPTQTLLLSPQGHVEFHAEVLDDGARTFMVVDPGTAQGLADFLTGMRFLTRVEVRNESADWALMTVRPVSLVDSAASVVIPRAWPTDSADVLVPRSAAEVFWGQLVDAGARPVGYAAYEAMRIADGHARLGLDTDHRTLVHEVGWVESAVHLHKGCYRGQETVARVHNLGRPPRRLVMVHLDGSDHLLPPRGAELRQGGRVVGTLTSVARHAELGPIGLALLKRSAADDQPLTTADGVAVAVERDISSPTEPVDLGAFRG